MFAYTAKLLNDVKEKAPLIHNITNFVVMNSSANMLLAIGASPVMAHCKDEVAEMVSMAGALVLNIGTLQDDWVDAMILAGKYANESGIPVILDPVGAGATRLRTRSALRIMDECRVSVLRGNTSEIHALSGADVKTRGVDSSLALSDYIVESASRLARKRGIIVAVSDVEDCICDGDVIFRVKNGHPLMAKVTGMGCGLSAITAAFCAVSGNNPTMAVAAAFGFYGICGELAAQISDKPGSFQTAFLDCLFSTGQTEIDARLCVNS